MLCPTKPAALPIDAAFPDPTEPPRTAELTALLGQEHYREVHAIESWLDTTYPALPREWKYSGKCGWYVAPVLKKRRLYYLVPRTDGFRFNIILGNHALISLAEGPHARRLARVLETAKHYPEGTALSFNDKTLDAEFGIALVLAKIKH